MNKAYISSALFLSDKTDLALTDMEDGSIVVHFSDYPITFSLHGSDADFRRLYNILGAHLSGNRVKEAA